MDRGEFRAEDDHEANPSVILGRRISDYPGLGQRRDGLSSSHSQKLTLLSLWAAVVIIVGILAIFVPTIVYYVGYEPSWLTYPNSALAVQPPKVRPGGTIALTVIRESTERTKRSYNVSRSLICEGLKHEIGLPGGSYSVEPGVSNLTILLVIPKEVPDAFGQLAPFPHTWCYVDGLSEPQGKIRTILVPFHSKRFEVDPSLPE